jgi:hypothetical protein
MAAFDLAAANPLRSMISQRQRDSLYAAADEDGGITLNSEDDGPQTELTTDSTFNEGDNLYEDDEDDDDDDGEPASAAAAAVAIPLMPSMDDAGSSGEDDEEEDAAAASPMAIGGRVSSERSSARHPPVLAAVDRRQEVATCPICWDEQPYIADKTKRSAMNDRYADFRDVMYRYYNQMRGRQSQETVLRGMLDIRREKIERYLNEYSSSRFTRWTMDMLRRHFDPRSGHRFDAVIALDQEIDDLRQLQRWTMEHGMWVDHPQTGERVFNIRAVDVRLRIGRLYLDAITKKSIEMEKRSKSSAGDTDMIVSALSTIGNGQQHSRSKRRRKDAGAGETTVERMYSVGGM